MASGYNRIIIVGNLTRDPELKQLSSGQSVCRLGIASNRQFRNRQSGDMVQEVCYVDVDVWGPQAESSNQYLEKGRQVLIEGRLKLDTWQDTDGKNRSKHSIVADRVVFLASGSDASAAGKEPEDLGAFEPRNDVERELMNQLEEVKAKASSSSEGSKKTVSRREPSNDFSMPTGAQPFRDEPPFQDDLPF